MQKCTGICTIDDMRNKLQMYSHVSKRPFLLDKKIVFKRILLNALKLSFVCVDIEVSNVQGTMTLKTGL